MPMNMHTCLCNTGNLAPIEHLLWLQFCGSDGALQQSWSTDSSWAKLQVVCAVWGPAGGSVLVLTAARVMCIVPWGRDAAQTGEVV